MVNDCNDPDDGQDVDEGGIIHGSGPRAAFRWDVVPSAREYAQLGPGGSQSSISCRRDMRLKRCNR